MNEFNEDDNSVKLSKIYNTFIIVIKHLSRVPSRYYASKKKKKNKMMKFKGRKSFLTLNYYDEKESKQKLSLVTREWLDSHFCALKHDKDRRCSSGIAAAS
ncbi:hypothetical protein ACKWTF_010750 [Chironomus riparius]